MSERAVVLLSGGLDSTTALAVAKSEGIECYALTANYDQRHYIECARAREIARAYRVVDHRVIDLPRIGGSALTDFGANVPKGQDPGRECPPTYVPARNMVLLSLAASWAEAVNARHVFCGFNVLDASGYPDCRLEFLEAFGAAASLGMRRPVRFRAPLIALTKAQIISLGLRLGVDYSRTWTCYDPQGDTTCGACDACQLRAKGFAELGIKDPGVL